MNITTDSRFMEHNSPRMTGSESYPVTGGLVTDKEVRRVISQFSGLTRQWDCFEKATIARKVVGGMVTLGSLFVWNIDLKSNFGYGFNPPFEFHAWIQMTTETIVDFALPGVIEAALLSRDEQGPLVTGRDPFILAGHPPAWCQYKPFKYIIGL